VYKKAKVIGYPIAQSKSPQLHGYWLKKYGIDGEYTKQEVKPENLEIVIRSLKSEGYVGFNTTVPHKEEIMKYLDQVSDIAKKIGAVNTVIIKDDIVYGTNTDGYGFVENIKNTDPGFNFSLGPAIVLGAGGAARSIVVALLNEGVPKVIITNRTRERAEEIKKHLKDDAVEVVDWEKRNDVLSEGNLLVNTTTLGMDGQPKLQIDLSNLPADALVCDIVYKPLITDLLSQAQQKGNKIVDGIGMLLYQAVPGFEAWFGKKPEVTEELRNLILNDK
tara:strand:+ start:1225 stop:2052 length:828 start_codon:yes stop_codon:yes gene_type:complete